MWRIWVQLKKKHFYLQNLTTKHFVLKHRFIVWKYGDLLAYSFVSYARENVYSIDRQLNEDLTKKISFDFIFASSSLFVFPKGPLL
jgi:hypothetical protein